MKLQSGSLDWAVKHLVNEGDTDLFPVPFELAMIDGDWATLKSNLEKIEINAHVWSGPRRLMVPKAEFSFRAVCQFDPIDALLFASLIREIGKDIEAKRSPASENKVFSNRFKPTKSGRLYSQENGWEKFWSRSRDLSEKYPFVLVTDIADFYNQIYHHTIENQLLVCGFGKEVVKTVKNLLANTTEGVSRGIPVGPHASHILAEMSLIPLDNFMTSQGYEFCRYVDDINIFFESYKDAQRAMFSIVEYLDKTQKVQLNRQKTKIVASTEFKEICADKMIDDPINDIEAEVLKVIRGKVNDPYRRIKLSNLSEQEMSQLSQENIEAILDAYLSADEIDYTRLRWFIRRLAQVGAPGGIEYIINKFGSFLPAISDVGVYFDSARANYKGKWNTVGEKLLEALQSDVVQASEYLRVIIISLFSRVVDLNHTNGLTKLYDREIPACQREIIIAAANVGAADWLRRFKDQYKNADPWLRRAMIYGCKAFPKDERDFWLKSVRSRATPLELAIIKQVA